MLRLAHGFPAQPTPDDASFIFAWIVRDVGPARIDPALIRIPVERVLEAVTRLEFNLPDPVPFEQTFQVRNQRIRTHSRAEAAYLEALAFGVAIDEQSYFNDTTRLARWAPQIRGLTLENLASEFGIASDEGVEVVPTEVEREQQVPDLRTMGFNKAMRMIADVRPPARRIKNFSGTEAFSKVNA